jgi:hypothetical protein
MTATLIPAAARKLGCRNSIAAVVVDVILRKADQGWTSPRIAEWFGHQYGAGSPTADPAFVAWVLAQA